MRDFLRGGFVVRRNAAHGIGDAAVKQLEPVVDAGGVMAAREAEFSQSRVQEIAGVVAGERPPGAVGAAQPGGKAHDQKPRVVGSKGIDRSVKPARLALAPRLAKRHQPRTARAIAAGHSARAHPYSSSNSSSTSTR